MGTNTLITWASFEREFRSKYVSDSHVEDHLRKFLDLRQQELIVDTYEQQFTYLAQFAKGFLPSEREHCRRFKEGLRLHIWTPGCSSSEERQSSS